MAKSGMTYRGKELLECELDKLTPEQMDIAILETNSRIQMDLNRELAVSLAKTNADYTEKVGNILIDGIKDIIS